jgi:diguanylate cyclase (GGDEF)-like protein
MTEQSEGLVTETLDVQSPPLAIPGKLAFLVVTHGKDQGKRFDLPLRRLSIGRSGEADIVIDDERISRVHCAILRTDGMIIVEDRDSKNGLFVDGRRVDSAILSPNSSLQIGQTVMHVEFKDRTQIEYEVDLYRNATIDELTGIANRRHFINRCTEELPLARRSGAPAVLVMIDVDRFKEVNDSFGHLAGDYVLRTAAGLIDACKRAEDLLGRYGGDEFVVMLRGRATREEATAFCERIRASVAAHPFEFNGSRLPVTVSIGFCSMAADAALSFDDLVACADRAMYAAKSRGRNRVECQNVEGAG